MGASGQGHVSSWPAVRLCNTATYVDILRQHTFFPPNTIEAKKNGRFYTSLGSLEVGSCRDGRFLRALIVYFAC